MSNSIEVYDVSYQLKLENEMLKYENDYLKSLINLSYAQGTVQKKKAYIDLINLMSVLRKKPISYFCRKHKTFVLFETRYFTDYGEAIFDTLLNHRAESDLVALLSKINKTPLSPILSLSTKYRKLINEYL